MNLKGAWAVFRFECRRTATVPRLMWFAALALFPPAIVLLMRVAGNPPPTPDFWAWVFFALGPMVVCLLGLLLWATPAIQSELEGKTWIYLAVRPGGKIAVLLGKYLTAVMWTALAGGIGLTLAVVLARPPDAFLLWRIGMVLVALSSIAYGALLTFLGVVMPRRAMALAFGYVLLLELLVSLIPAVINQLTVQYRLRCLLVKWVEWDRITETVALLGSTAPASQHILILAGATVALLAASAALLVNRQLITADES